MSTEAASAKSISSKEQQPPSTNVEDQQQPQNGTAEQQEGEGEGAPTEPEGGYPPQKHAGAVGLGPEYGQMRRTTMSDRIGGIKEEIAGKITHNQDKVQHGKEMRTGELKRKKLEESENANPFLNEGNEKDDAKDEQKDEQEDEEQSGDRKRAKTDGEAATSEAKEDDDRMQEDTDPGAGHSDVPGTGNAAPSSVTGKRGPGTHPTEKGAMEQAATTAPAGTEEAEQQRRGENTYADKQIDEGQHTAPSA